MVVILLAAMAPADEPAFTKQIAALKALRCARVGHYEFEKARVHLKNLYEQQLKPRPDLMAREVPIGSRETADDFIEYAEFFYSTSLQSKRGLSEGESSDEFFFIDIYGVWKGRFKEPYTKGKDFIGSSMFRHPITRKLIRVNLARGIHAPGQSEAGRFGRFEDREYPLTKVKLISEDEAKPYIEELLISMIQERMREIEAGFVPDKLKGQFVNALSVTSELEDRKDVFNAVGTAYLRCREILKEQIAEERKRQADSKAP